MKAKLSQRHPVIASILWVLLLLFFYFIGGAVVTITKATPTKTLLIQAIFVFAACLTAIIYICNSTHSFSDYGFNKPTVAGAKKMLFYLPLLIMEIIPFYAGLKVKIDFSFIIAALVCTLCVGFAEEVYFRGFVLNILKAKGIGFSIIISSVLFGLGHILNIAGGANPAYTILQVFFAFFFGIVFAEMAVITRTIIPGMILHFLHDFIAFNTKNGSAAFCFTGVMIEVVILIAFSVYLYFVIKRERAASPENC